MKAHYIGDDRDKQKDSGPEMKDGLLTFAGLKQLLEEMNIYADLEIKPKHVIVRVPDHTGTSQFYATSSDDHFSLKKLSYKTDRKGSFQLYYMKIADLT